jgi:hypothetical protein
MPDGSWTQETSRHRPTDDFVADAAAAAEIHSLIDAAREGRISLDPRSELKMVDIDHSARMLIMSGV